MKEHNATELTYYIAYSGKVYHNGEIEAGLTISTGLDNLETFTDKSEYENRLSELGFG